MALGFLSGWFKLPKLKCEATMDPLGADESLLQTNTKIKSVFRLIYIHAHKEAFKEIFWAFSISHIFDNAQLTSQVVVPIPDQEIKLRSHQVGLK